MKALIRKLRNLTVRQIMERTGASWSTVMKYRKKK
jgi:hypothetical protein